MDGPSNTLFWSKEYQTMLRLNILRRVEGEIEG